MTSVTMSDADKKVLSDFIVMNETIKRLDKDKKKLSEEVKAIFDKYHIDTVDHDGSTLTVTESVRKTVTSKKKDLFIQCKNGIVNKVLALLSLLTSKSLNFLQKETVLSVLLAILIFIIFVINNMFKQ